MYKIISKSVAVLLLAAAVLTACKNDVEAKWHYADRFVSKVYINTSLSVYPGQSVVIQGRGFKEGDTAVFKESSSEIAFPLADINDYSARFTVNKEIKRGLYDFYITRGEVYQKICRINVWITQEFEVPEREGYNLRGAVFCDKTGLAGVEVSDGYKHTVTDGNGFYWLDSDKQNGFVWISLPSGYMPTTGTNPAPGYWATIATDKELSEQCNFELRKVDNTNHTIIFAADLHLANRDSANRDMSQFHDGFMKDSQALAASYGLEKTYAIMLGDQTWDRYWYVQRYNPLNYYNTVKDYPIPMFNAMGNHDNDCYAVGDEAGEAYYKSIFGPSYYSFNLGDVHYIVLDNIVWRNAGASDGVMGDRTFGKNMPQAQFDWLKYDLSLIQNKEKPLFICVHCPLYNSYNDSGAVKPAISGTRGTEDIAALLAPFKNVHIVSGHTHHNNTMVVSDNLIEHNIGAVCECWWWSGKYSGRGICADGSPAGFSVFEINGSDIEWYYKGSSCERSEQFRTYDMNVVKNYLNDYVDILNRQTEPIRDTGGNDYGDLRDNTVYINVWDYDPLWTISVTENGTPLKVKSVYDRDPLHTICYDILRIQNGGDLNGSNASIRNSHMFSVQASSANSSLDITVTNRFGKTYTERMTRPKAYNIQMK